MSFAIVTVRWALCAGALASAACSGGLGSPTSPSAGAVVSGPPAASPLSSARDGDVHVTKECSGFNGLEGSHCTITTSNIKAIEVGSKVIYLQPGQLFSAVGSDVVLDTPGPGNNKAFGHCSLALGQCDFSGGTGKFSWFQASIDVTSNLDGSVWYWEGTYDYSPHQ